MKGWLWRLVFCALLAGAIASVLYHQADSISSLLTEYQARQQAAALSAIRPSLLTSQKLPIVFVHGINDTGASWDEMRAHLRSLGWTDNLLYTNTFSCTGLLNCSNVTNANEIAQWVNAASVAHGGAQVILIAHSMGGVSSRYFLKNSAAASKVAAFISLGSMNNGMLLSCPANGFKILGFDIGATICNELLRSGTFIPALWQTTYEGIPAVNFYSANDKTVSTGAAYVPGACNVQIANVGHVNIHRSTLRASDQTGDPGIPKIQAALQAFLRGDPYNTFCEPELAIPSVQQLTSGIKKFLVVPVMFADTPTHEQRTPAQLDAIFGTATQVGAIGEYFRQISDNGTGAKYQPVFMRTDTVRLPGNLLPIPTFAYASFGGVKSEEADDLLNGASVTDGSANDLDRALCSVTVGGQAVDLAQYDGIVVLYQDSLQRHFNAQRVNAGFFERWREGAGLYIGVANTVPLVVHDCPTGDLKKSRHMSFVGLFTGVSWQDDTGLKLTAVHELGHAMGFGHSNWLDIEYGNQYDLMSVTDRFANTPSGLSTALTGWFTPAGNMRAVSTSGTYTLNTIESKQYPTGLSFTLNGIPGAMVLERHDGTDASIALRATSPKESGLLAVQQSTPGSFGVPRYVHNNRTVLTTSSLDGLEVGSCGVLDLGNRAAVYRYRAEGSVDVKFTDDADYTDGKFGCGIDLQVEDLKILGEPTEGVPVTVTAMIKNVGDTKLASTYDAVLDFVLDETEQESVGSKVGSQLKVGEDETFTFSWTPQVAGESGEVRLRAVAAGDLNHKNNSKSIKVFVRPRAGQAIPVQPVKQRINIEKTGGGDGAVAVSVQSRDGKSNQSWSCDIGATDCGLTLEVGSRVTLVGVPEESVAFTGFTGAYCNGLKTCSFTVAGAGTVTLGLVPTAQITLAKDGSGASAGSIALSYREPGNSTDSQCVDNCVGQTFTVVAGSLVTATAIPTQNESQFWAWTGCTSTPDEKSVCRTTAPTLGQSLTIKATFKKLVQFRFVAAGELAGTLQYSVREPGWTSAAVQEKPFTTFEEKRPEGTSISVTYVPPADLSDRRVRLLEWLYDAPSSCGANTTCPVTLGSTDVRFGATARYQYKITIGHEGTNGRVTLSASNPGQGSITCPASNTAIDCNRGWYWRGSNLVVEAIPNSGHTFDGWVADCQGASEVCYKSGLSSPATIRAAAFPVHYYTFYVGRDCDSRGSERYVNPSDASASYCGQGDIIVDFETQSTMFSSWQDYLNQRYKTVPGTDFWLAEAQTYDSWVERWSCWVNSPYRCVLEGGGRDLNGNGYVDVTIYQGNNQSSFSKIDQFGLLYSFRSDEDLARAPSLNSSLARSSDLPSRKETWFRAEYGSQKPVAGPTGIGHPVGPSITSPDFHEDLDAQTPMLQNWLASVIAALRTPYDLPFRPRVSAAPLELPSAEPLRQWFSSAQKNLEQSVRRPLRSVQDLLSGWVWRARNLAAVGSLGSPDLVARQLYINDCTGDCVLPPGESVELTAFITNESFTPTTQAFGTNLTIRKRGDSAENDLVLYRYNWNGIGAQAATTSRWVSDWTPGVGVYELTLAVDDWQNIDPNNANDTRTISVVVSDTPVTLTTGVRDAFGGRVAVQGGPGATVICTGVECTVTSTQGSYITMNAIPDANRAFVQWEGAQASNCVISNFATSTCQLKMVNAKTVKAYFETVGPTLSLEIDTENGGAGTVSSTNTGGARDFSNCGTSCAKPFVAKSTVALTATPAAGSYFSRWGGADAERCAISGGGTICTLRIKEGEAAEIRPLFVKGTIPQQQLIVRPYGVGGGVVEVRDPQNNDALIGTCAAESCTYSINVPSAEGKPLTVVPIANVGWSFDRFVSPLVDLTPDGTFTQAGCYGGSGNFNKNDLARLKDGNRETWFTCRPEGRIGYSSQGNQRITRVEAYLPSITRSVDSGAYETAIKDAVARKYGLSRNDPVIQYNTNGIQSIISDLLSFRDTQDNNPRRVAQIGAISSQNIRTVDVKLSTEHRPSLTGASHLIGVLHLEVTNSSGTTRREFVEFGLPGPAYTDAQLGNVLIQQYADNAYATKGTLTKGGGLIETSFSGVEASSLSFKTDGGNPIRIGDIVVRGTFRNPCESVTMEGACNLQIRRSAPTVVPVSFTAVPVTAKLGDVDGSGSVFASDALLALKIAVGQEITTPHDRTAADVNCDGEVVATDALFILQAAVGTRTLTSCSAVQGNTSLNYGFVDIQALSGVYEVVTSYGALDGEVTTEEVQKPAAAFGTTVDVAISPSGAEYVYTGTVRPAGGFTFVGCGGDCVQTSSTTFRVATEGYRPKTAYVYMKPPEGFAYHSSDGGTFAGLVDYRWLTGLITPGISDPLPPEPEISDPLPPVPEGPRATSTPPTPKPPKATSTPSRPSQGATTTPPKKPTATTTPFIPAPPKPKPLVTPSATSTPQIPPKKSVATTSTPQTPPQKPATPATQSTSSPAKPSLPKQPVPPVATSTTVQPPKKLPTATTTTTEASANKANLLIREFKSTPPKAQVGIPVLLHVQIGNEGTLAVVQEFTATMRFDQNKDGAWEVTKTKSFLGLPAGGREIWQEMYSPTSAETVAQVCITYASGTIVEKTTSDNCKSITISTNAKSVFDPRLLVAAVGGVTRSGVGALGVLLAVLIGTALYLRRK